MPVEKVVAKVSVLGGKPAADSFANMAYSADDLAAALDKAAAAAERLGVLLPALTKDAQTSATSMAMVAKATNDAAGVTTTEVTAADAATLATQRRTAATVASTTAVENATVAHKNFGTALSDLASSPITTKIAKWGLGAGALTMYEGIKQYTHMTTAMTQLVTQAQLAPSSLPMITKGALEISASTGLALTDVANQLYRIKSANVGLHMTNKELLTMGRNAANLSVLFNTSPGVQTEQLARLFGALSVAGAGNKLQGVGSPQHIMALLNATIGAGDIRGTDLVGGLGRGVLQSAQAVHAKLPDVLTWMALATKFAANASTSGTLIAHSLQQIATPSEQGAKAEAMVGIAPGQLRTVIQNQGISQAISLLMGNMGKGFNPNPAYPVTGKNPPGAASALQQLTNWGFKMNPQDAQAFLSGTMNASQKNDVSQYLLTKIFGGARQEIPILTIAENQKLFKTMETDIMRHATPAVIQKDLSIAMNTPGRQLQIARQNLDIALYNVGKIATPIFVDAMKSLADVGKWFSKNPGALKGALIGLGSLIGSAMALYAGGKIASLVKDLGGFGSKAVLVGKQLSSFLLGTPGIIGKIAPDARFEASVVEFGAAVNRFALESKGGGIPGVGLPGGRGTTGTAEKDAKQAAKDALQYGAPGGVFMRLAAKASRFIKLGPGYDIAAGGEAAASDPIVTPLVIGAAATYGLIRGVNALLGPMGQNKYQAQFDKMWQGRSGAFKSQYLGMESHLLDTIKNQASLDAALKAYGWNTHQITGANNTAKYGYIGQNANQTISHMVATATNQIHHISNSHQSSAAKQWERVAALNKDVLQLRKDATQQEKTAWADGAKGQTAAAKAHEAAAKKLSDAADKLNSVTIQISASSIAKAVNQANGTGVARTAGSYYPTPPLP